MKLGNENHFKSIYPILLVVSFGLCFGCNERQQLDKAKNTTDQASSGDTMAGVSLLQTNDQAMATNHYQYSKTNESKGALGKDDEVIQAVKAWFSAHNYSIPNHLSIIERKSNYWVVADMNLSSLAGFTFRVDPKTKHILEAIGE